MSWSYKQTTSQQIINIQGPPAMQEKLKSTDGTIISYVASGITVVTALHACREVLKGGL